MKGYSYRIYELKNAKNFGQEYLLKRKLFKFFKTGEIIHKDMVDFHYPYRWKYDCFRYIEYCVKDKHPFDIRMKETLNLIKDKISKGYI